MKRMQKAAIVFVLGTLLGLPASPARAEVIVERQGQENPMVEVFKSTVYGALAGIVVGLAIEAADDGSDQGEAIRWGFVAGTGAGLLTGVYFTARRAPAEPVLEFSGGALHYGAFQPDLERGGARVRLIGTRF